MDFNMWNDKKSLVLSKICIILFMVLLVVSAVSARWIVNVLLNSSVSAALAGRALFLLTIYAGCVPSAALLVCLYLLLHRIGSERVFVRENTACLRHISWCCFVGAAICLASAFYYLPWMAVGVAASFMGLIVRVIKNVIAKAVSLQDDADFTI